MTYPDRLRAEKRGRRAEAVARILLSLKGYRIIAMRYKTKAGEIDIVARKKDVLVFVEVKARADLETAKRSLYPKMQKRIENACEIFVARHDWAQTLNQRFDTIFVMPGVLGLPKLVHQKDAWRAW